MISITVDHANCTPSCAFSAYEVLVQRTQPPAAPACTLAHETSSTRDVVIGPIAELRAGDRVEIAVAAHCPAEDAAVASADLGPAKARCCELIASCLEDMRPENPPCNGAKVTNICPQEARPPPFSIMQAYYASNCPAADADGGAGGTASCVRCFATTTATLQPGTPVTLALRPSAGCTVAELQPAGPCAP